ncbi:MAG: TonB-dependent receptor plug domain-containing protein, partial [Thermoanaerobaculia bacterium]
MHHPLGLLALLLATNLHAFTGTLQFPDGTPCARCMVSVLDRAATARADAEGQFELNPVPQPPFEIIVIDANGVVYPTLRVVSEGVIIVTPAHQESITVVSGVAPSIESSPAAAESMIAREDLEIRAPATVADAIAAVPGASKSDAGPTAVPSIRGLARGRTVLLLDGARVTAERRAGSSATFVDPFSLAAVELARGAGGVGYGSDAFGGVIELQPRYPEPAREGQVFYQLGVTAGGSELAAGGVEITGGGEKHAYLLDFHARSGGDDETPDGRALTTGYRARGFALRYRGVLPSGEFRAALSVDEGRDIERPTADSATRPTTYPIETSRRFNLAADLGAHLGFEHTRVEGFAGTYRLVLERGEMTDAGMGAEISDVDSSDASLRVLAGRAFAGGWLDAGYDFTTRFGLEAIVTKEAPGSDPVDTTAIEDAHRLDHGLFASWNRPFAGGLILGLGVRGDAVRSENRGGWFGDHADDRVAPSGLVSLTAALARDLSATLQVSSGFRDPTLSDRYYRGPSGRGTITGNPELDPERSVQADGALRWSRGR